MVNTEKPSTKAEQKKQSIVKTPKVTTDKIPQKEDNKEKKVGPKEVSPGEKNKKKEVKKVEVPKIKRTEAVINALSIPISTKHSIAMCKFIKYKSIDNAIKDLEEVLVMKKAVPMKGEIPHRKGKGMMSGRFPKKASENFIRLLKSLSSNANTNDMDSPIISEAIANIAQRPMGRFGQIRKKRTHITIKVKEKKLLRKQNKKKVKK